MISILMYHQVDNVPIEVDPLGIAMSSENFEKQMRYLYENAYQCISLAEAVKIWQGKKKEPDKTIVITFDDGFRDLYTTVRPILQQFGFTATVFLVVNQIGDLSNWEGQAPYPLLSWDEVRELRQYGFTFGSHTLTHPFLTGLSDEDARREIRESKDYIEKQLGEKIDFFAYPYSDMDLRIQNIVQESGYLAACSGGRLDWNFFNMWRALCTRNDGSQTYKFKARGWYRYEARLRQNNFIRPIGRTLKRLFLNT